MLEHTIVGFIYEAHYRIDCLASELHFTMVSWLARRRTMYPTAPGISSCPPSWLPCCHRPLLLLLLLLLFRLRRWSPEGCLVAQFSEG